MNDKIGQFGFPFNLQSMEYLRVQSVQMLDQGMDLRWPQAYRDPDPPPLLSCGMQ